MTTSWLRSRDEQRKQKTWTGENQQHGGMRMVEKTSTQAVPQLWSHAQGERERERNFWRISKAWGHHYIKGRGGVQTPWLSHVGLIPHGQPYGGVCRPLDGPLVAHPVTSHGVPALGEVPPLWAFLPKQGPFGIGAANKSENK